MIDGFCVHHYNQKRLESIQSIHYRFHLSNGKTNSNIAGAQRKGGHDLTRKTGKTIVSWGLALLFALVIANGISFFYRSGAGSIQRENAYSTSIRTPNSSIVRGSEGYGINHVDAKGYLNDDKLPLAEHCILLMGSSHAEGLQVMQKDNMASVLNDRIDPTVRTVYNLGTAGQTLPRIIEGFQAALEEFPNADAILIEMSQMEFATEDLVRALDQARFDPASTGEALEESLSASRRIRNSVLLAMPLVSLLRQQVDSMSFSMAGAFGIDRLVAQANSLFAPKNTADAAQNTAPASAGNPAQPGYAAALNQALALIRSETGKPIILLYHPGVGILADGTIAIDRDIRYYNDYRSACENNNIVFLDTGDAFLEAYQKDYSIPYGFTNTTFLTGHLNQTGHRIVAETFFQALTELQEKEKN